MLNFRGTSYWQSTLWKLGLPIPPSGAPPLCPAWACAYENKLNSKKGGTPKWVLGFALLTSPLATKTERKIVQDLAVFYESGENGGEGEEADHDIQDER